MAQTEEDTARVSVTAVQPGIRVLTVRGPLNAGTEPALVDGLAAGASEEPRATVLDLAGVTRMDGDGLSLLVKTWAWTCQGGQRLLACGLGARCRRLLQELGLGTAIHLHRSLGSALRAVGATEPFPEGEAVPEGEACTEEWAESLEPAPPGRAGDPAETRNVAGRGVRGPFGGFGQLWNKRYRIRLSGVGATAAEVMKLCRERLGEFWPPGNRLLLPASGLVPGAVGGIELRLPGGAPLTTGLRVVHVDDRSFTFVPLAGHMEAGWITFSAWDDECPVVQVESLARTSDPVYEAGFLVFGHAEQERFWRATLERLGQHYGLLPRVEISKTCLDAGRQWSGVPNVAFNAAVLSGLHLAVGALGRIFRRRRT